MLSVLVALLLTVKPPYQGSGRAVSSTSPKNMGEENMTRCRGGDSGYNGREWKLLEDFP
jgi:hypothetical protein